MTFWSIYLQGGLVVLSMMTLLWLVSIPLKNVSIVDIFWGLGYVMVGQFYYFGVPGFGVRKIIVVMLVTFWGVRLSLHLAIRNWGKPEDYRYQNFRATYGVRRYWWFSYFQTFLLQGVLMWLISAPLLGAMFGGPAYLSLWDVLGLVLWCVGFLFETIGDAQLAQFKRNPVNKGRLFTGGLWRYTRHPNYFGDAMVWWGLSLFSVASASYWPLFSSLLMTFLLLKVSGVKLLEKDMKKKPGYEDYMKDTSAFFPWWPKKSKA